MKKHILIIAMTLKTFLCISQQTNYEAPSVPINEVTNENKNAIIITITQDTLRGIVNFNEYNKRIAYLKTIEENEKSIIKNIPEDSIQFMSIEGRGDFYRFPNKAHLMLEINRTDAYSEYRSFNSVQGMLGAKFSGGNIQGSYHYYIIIKKTSQLVYEKDLKNLDKSINEYINYCPEVTDKVKNEEKGYKKSLLKSNFILLKEVVEEAHNKCGI